MFFYVEFLIALLVALFFTSLIAAGLRKSGSKGRILSIFFLILLSAWAGAVWITPVDQDFSSIFIVVTVVVGLIAALILAVSAYPNYPIFQREERSSQPQQTAKSKYAGAFFWVLLVILIAAILGGYLIR
ncbi:hypothetical protein CHISP_0634 [Chitinispirillum alkaliphilum]|nr:hypothetical protein CHISP_0634 [Chitinispirillum alkaliphilum]